MKLYVTTSITKWGIHDKRLKTEESKLIHHKVKPIAISNYIESTKWTLLALKVQQDNYVFVHYQNI